MARVSGLVAEIFVPELAHHLEGAVDGALYAGRFVGAAMVQYFALHILAGLPSLTFSHLRD